MQLGTGRGKLARKMKHHLRINQRCQLIVPASLQPKRPKQKWWPAGSRGLGMGWLGCWFASIGSGSCRSVKSPYYATGYRRSQRKRALPFPAGARPVPAPAQTCPARRVENWPVRARLHVLPNVLTVTRAPAGWALLYHPPHPGTSVLFST